VVLEHAARRITAADRRGDSSIPSADDVDVVGFIDAWFARIDARFRRDMGRFLAYLEHAAPLASGFGSRFSRLDPAKQDEVLSSVEASQSELLRAGFEGIKSLVFMGYYRDARTWRAVGYDGPWVGRPADGWQ
jgi:Gluconate 2-dehydrogenase subunit 3